MSALFALASCHAAEDQGVELQADAGCTALPPARPAAAGPAPQSESVFAISRIYFDDPSAGPRDGGLPKLVGYDMPAILGLGDGGAPCGGSFPAGACGVRNAMGWWFHDVQDVTTWNDLITSGAMAVPLIRARGISSGNDVSTARVDWLRSAPLGHAPAWDGSDTFAARSESLLAGALDAPRVVLEHAYVTGATLVANEDATLPLELATQGGFVVLTIHHAVLTMDLDGDLASAHHGILAGTLDPQETGVAMTDGAYGSAQVCDANIFDVLRQMADIRFTPGSYCTAISIAVGFEAEAVKIGGVAPALDAPTPCKGWTL